MISNTELYDKKKIISQAGTTEAEINLNTADTLQISATNIELTGTLTNNGSPIAGGGSPNDGRLAINMNGQLQDNSFTANTSSNVTVDLYNIMKVNVNSSSGAPTILPNSFYDLTYSSGVSDITLRESNIFVTNGYLNEYFCKFKAQTTEVTIDSYDNRTITWSTEGEQYNNLKIGDVYFLDVIAYEKSGTYVYYGVIRKFQAN